MSFGCASRLIFGFFVVLAAQTAFAGLTPQLALLRGARFLIDYNRDGVADATISYGGGANDKGLVGDFNGDTISDLVIYRRGYWYISLYNDAKSSSTAVFVGAAEDIPLTADVNGDGLADLVLYRPSTGVWYVKYNHGGSFSRTSDLVSRFGGLAGDVPVLGDFDGDGTVDRAIYRNGSWYIDLKWNGTTDKTCAFGGAAGDIPLAADFNGDWVDDLVIFHNGTWTIDTNCDGAVDQTRTYGRAGDRPFVGVFNTANSLFVNAAAATGGNGSQRFPAKTVAQALALASAGTTIRIAAGTYPAPIVIGRANLLTLLGAGWNATHVTASSDANQDALRVALSSAITLRNLHVASPYRRGIVNQGSSLTLDRVSTVGNYNHAVLALSTQGTKASLSVLYSRLDETQIGTGLRLEGGVTARVFKSSISYNGKGSTDPAPSTQGRGVEVLVDSQLIVSFSTVAYNHDGGIQVDNNGQSLGSATVEYSKISHNGTDGMGFGHNTKGLVRYNTISYNGEAIANNGIEILAEWNGPSMKIYNNTFAYNHENGILISSGTATVVNNYFNSNRVAVWIARTPTVPANVTVQGNIFDVKGAQDAHLDIATGVFITENLGPPTVTIGGPTASQVNSFENYLGFPAIACNTGTADTICRLSWNQFVNSNRPTNTRCNCPP